MANPTVAILAARVEALEIRMEELMVTAQEILVLVNQANAQLDAIAAKLTGQVSQAEATAIRDALSALLIKAQQLAA